MQMFSEWMQRDFNTVLRCNVPRKIMADLYNYCLSDGLTRIEDLPIEKKWELFNKAKEIYPNGYNELLTTISRVLWLKESV